MAWTLLVIAASLEVVWALALDRSDGFTRLWPSILGISVAVLSFVLLTLALRGLHVGTAYAVWVGLGAVGVAVAGMLVAGEPASLARLSFLALIITGVVGLRLVDGSP
ncbi:DMT family transporter [Saccharomonospora halophila]|uniref:DMT family transporter n=1 Tax=Saccharomonospora halophila TaxID=129922 RepID=UPI00037A439F|nr:multidrug efflux SMR transporter [Saccharomonospora halophila]